MFVIIIAIFIYIIIIPTTAGPARQILLGGALSKAPKGNGIGATGSKNWVWF